MMSTDAGDKKILPAYVSFETVKSFTDSLKNSKVPEHIDRSMMRSMSGAVQSHLMSALRFLRLIEGSDDRVTDSFRHLVESSGTPEWKPALKAVLDVAYSEIVAGIDVGSTTDKKLRDAFRNSSSLDGSMLDRVVRFYLKALKEAGAEVSPHLGNRKPRGASAKRGPAVSQRKRLPGDATPDRGTDANGAGESPQDRENRGRHAHETPSGMIDFPIPMRDKPGFIRVRADITLSDYAIAEAMLNAVKVLAQTNSENRSGS